MALVLGVPSVAEAAPKPKKYASCAALNKDYPRGITYSKRWQREAVKGGYLAPKVVNYNIYERNDHLEPGLFDGPIGSICVVRPAVAPSAVQALSATSTLKNQILLTWIAPETTGPDPLVYDVYRDGVKVVEGLSTKSFVDQGLADGAQHSYEVVARNPIGETRLGVVGKTAPAPTAPSTPPPAAPAAPSGIRYANCDAARAAGVTPIRRGTPTYDANRHLDRDGDGVACE